LDQDLKQVAQKVAENCKSNPKDGFVVLQGEKYL
jgi:L-asparaginase/Glu-tRNA(Gln) amidotransferase subunit D